MACRPGSNRRNAAPERPAGSAGDDCRDTPGLVRGLLPRFIAVAEGEIDKTDGALWPEEAVQIARGAASRRREFVAGRVLAHRALTALGGPEAPILADEDRVPCWPGGFAGSISHSPRYAAAAVVRLDEVAGIGIDVEETGRFRVELERHILSPAEIARHLEGRGMHERKANAAGIFSAKEAFYKAQFPVTRRRLTFHDVEVELETASGAFAVWRTVEATRRFAGRIAAGDGLVATAIWFAPGMRVEA